MDFFIPSSFGIVQIFDVDKESDVHYYKNIQVLRCYTISIHSIYASHLNLNGDLLEEKLQQNFMLLMMATLYYVTDFPLKYAILISLAQS